jgi:hypothetical protein
MDPEKSWKEVLKYRHKAGNKKKGDYFRFTIGFDGQEPGLHNISKIRELKAYLRAAISASVKLDRLVQCIIAKFFFFELDPIIVTNERNENGQFSCTGYILYRLRDKTDAFEALLSHLTKTSAVVLLGKRPFPGSIQDRSSIDRDGNFKKMVSFKASSRKYLIINPS